MSQYRDVCLFDSSEFERRYKECESTNMKNVPPIASYDYDLFLKYHGDNRTTLIHIAAFWGRLDILKRAHGLGVNLTVTDKLSKTALHYAASRGHVDMVKWLTVHPAMSDQLELRDKFGRTALHLAVIKKHVNVVKLLVDTAGVDVNVAARDGMTPLHMAWVGVEEMGGLGIRQYEQIVQILVSCERFVRIVDEPVGEVGTRCRITILDWAVVINSIDTVKILLDRALDMETPPQAKKMITPVHVAADCGYYQIMNALLENRKSTSWMVNKEDFRGRTPLHIAVIGGYMNCINTLIDNDGSLAAKDESGRTVIHCLFEDRQEPVSFLTELLDFRVRATGFNSSIVNLDFRVLAPNGEKQMAVVSALIRAVPSIKQMNVLQHPLVETFLVIKWKRLSFFFVILVIFQAIFVGVLFTYGFGLTQKRVEYSATRRVLFFFSCIMLCHNIVQLVMIPRYYAKKFETWFSLACATICIVVAGAGEIRFDSNSQNDKRSPSWVLQAISVAILLACFQMMLLFGRFPFWGYYALMFSTVLKNVLKVFLSVVWVIVGFSLSFSVLFHDNEQFDNPGKAFAKTVVMMMGEYEYTNLFVMVDVANDTLKDPDLNSGETFLLPIIGRVVFLVFIMLASVVMMNLMIGLAVIDIQELLNEGLVLGLLKQAEFATHLEQVTSHSILRCFWVRRCHKKAFEWRIKIPTQMSLGPSARSGMPSHGISQKLAEKLFELASRNEHLHKRFETASTRGNNRDSITETFLQFQEIFNKLEREIMRIKGMEFPKRDVEERRYCTTS